MAGCSAINCSNTTAKGYKMHTFPRDPIRRMQWMRNCRRAAHWRPTNNSRLCAIHFEENQYEGHRIDGLRKLKPYAIPTIFNHRSNDVTDGVKHHLEYPVILLLVSMDETSLNQQCENESPVNLNQQTEKEETGEDQAVRSDDDFVNHEMLASIKQETIEIETNDFELDIKVDVKDKIKIEPEELNLCEELDMKTEYSIEDANVKEEYTDDGKENELEEAAHEKYKCPHCTFTTNIKRGLNRHITVTHCKTDSNFVTCRYCPYKSQFQHQFKSHMLEKHSEDVKLNVLFNKCEHCSYKTRIRSKLERHVIDKHTQLAEMKWFHCSMCSFKEKSEGKLRYHIRRRHVNGYECAQCPFIAKLRGELYEHIKVSHKEVIWYNCKQCEFSTYKKRNLNSHRSDMHRSIDKLTWFKCQRCAYTTNRKATLKRHFANKHV